MNQAKLQQLQESLSSQKLARLQQQKYKEQLLAERCQINTQLADCKQQLATYNLSLEELNQLSEQIADISSLNSEN